MRAPLGGIFRRPPTQAPPGLSGDEAVVARHALSDLIETCKDGQYAFRTSAERIEATFLGELVAGRAANYEQAARELQTQLANIGGQPESESNAGGVLHRGWVGLRSMLASRSDEALLDRCEREEAYVTARYQAALEHPLPAAVKAVVERQAKDIRLSRERIHNLRECLKGKA